MTKFEIDELGRDTDNGENQLARRRHRPPDGIFLGPRGGDVVVIKD